MTLDFRDNAFLAVDQVFRADPKAVMISNDMGAFGLNALKEAFPTRVINGGISEQNIVSMAGGLASEGHPVFVFGILPHLLFRCYEQLRCDVCLLDLPVIILASGAGLAYGADGPTHHGVTDLPVLRSLPNLAAYTPSDGPAAKGQILAAAKRGRPAFIRLDKVVREAAYGAKEPFDSAVAAHGARTDGAAAIVTSGALLQGARAAAQAATNAGRPTYVVDVYRPAPWPIAELAEALAGAGRVIVADEHVASGSLAEAVRMALFGAGEAAPEILDRVLPDGAYLGVTDREDALARHGLDQIGLSSALMLGSEAK